MTGKSAPEPPRWQWRNLVTVTAAGTLQQADVLRARLAMEEIDAYVPNENTTTWAWYLQRAIQPGGIPVMVPSEQVDRALAVLAEIGQPTTFDQAPGEQDDRDAPQGAEESSPPVSPDQYAASAFRSGLLAVLFWPLAIPTLWFFLRAIVACGRAPVENRRTFQQRMLGALVIGILLPVSFTALLLADGSVAGHVAHLLRSLSKP